MSKQLSMSITNYESNASEDAAKGFANKLIRDDTVKSLLENIKHFGVLNLTMKRPCSRYDYALLQCQVLLEVKESHYGLGLSALLKESTLPGWPATTPLPTLLEVVQAISILLNCGHLFGTFATERAVFYELLHNEELTTCLIDTLNDEFKNIVTQTIESRSIFRFHQVLALRFIDVSLSEEVRLKALACLKPFIDEEHPLHEKIKWIVSESRRITYHDLHSRVLKDSVLNIDRTSLIRQLRGNPKLGFDMMFERQSQTLRLLRATDAYTSVQLFHTAQAASATIAHLHEYIQWRNKHRAISIAEIVDKLKSRPNDWPSENNNSFDALGSIWLPVLSDFQWHTVVHKLEPGREHSTWESMDFLLSPLPSVEQGMILYLYGDQKKLPFKPQLLLLKILHEMSSIVWKKSSSQLSAKEKDNALRLWRAIASLGLILLKPHLRDSLDAVLFPWANDDAPPAHGYAMVGKGQNGIEQLKNLIDRADELRSDELKQILNYIKARRRKGRFKAYWLLFLGSVEINNSHNVIAELDGLILETRDDRLVWHFIEVKTGEKQNTGKRQLKDFHDKCLSNDAQPAIINGKDLSLKGSYFELECLVSRPDRLNEN